MEKKSVMTLAKRMQLADWLRGQEKRMETDPRMLDELAEEAGKALGFEVSKWNVQAIVRLLGWNMRKIAGRAKARATREQLLQSQSEREKESGKGEEQRPSGGWYTRLGLVEAEVRRMRGLEGEMEKTQQLLGKVVGWLVKHLDFGKEGQGG